MINFPSHFWHVLFKEPVRRAQEFEKEGQSRDRHPAKNPEDTPLPRSADARRSKPDMEQLTDPHPLPDPSGLADETIASLLGRLGNGQLRSIAIWKWEGYSNEEIAGMLGCSSRAILRKLAFIRTIWANEEAG
jgi:DNA-directed RNA polymerase specialized sigma24 family protein